MPKTVSYVFFSENVTIATETRLRAQNDISQEEVFSVWPSYNFTLFLNFCSFSNGQKARKPRSATFSSITICKSRFFPAKKIWFWTLRRVSVTMVTNTAFYYASVRSLSLQRPFLGCFFDIGSAISRCGTTIKHYSRRKWGEGGRKEHKAETR